MFPIVHDYSSTVTNTKPNIVLMQADAGRLSAAVSLDPDRPWHRFVDDLAERRLFQPHHLSRVRQVWKQIRDYVGPRLGLPVTQPTPEGAVQLYWDTERKYLEVDVYSDGTLHWFYKDRLSGDRDGTDDERVRGVPVHLLNHVVALVS
ncbi:MAG: hypothetical protein EXR72_01980 [Myxococcales bacterium]|nr:hypothetical protein [Myxococcales bacterium]